MAASSSGSEDAWVKSAVDAAPPISVLGTVRVLYVEDDEMQQAALLALFETANLENAGAVTFQLSGALIWPQ